MLNSRKHLSLTSAGLLILMTAAAGCSSSKPADTAPAPAPTGSAAPAAQTPPAATGKLKIGYLAPDLGNQFWVRVANGVKDEAAKQGIDAQVLDAHTDPQAQVNQAENLVSQKVNAIIVSPWDTDTGSQVVAIARKANIPVFVADIGSKDTNYTSFVVSDNYQGGVKAADLLAKVAKGKSVAVLELQAGSVVAGQRHVGFKDQAKKVGLNIVASQPADSQRSLGMSVMENMLTAHPDIAGVFADNDEMALGALQALEAAGKKDIPVIGFDANGDALKAIKDGKMLATMAQFPEKMGATSVQSAVKAAKGDKVEKDIKLDVEVVTKDNVAQFLK